MRGRRRTTQSGEPRRLATRAVALAAASWLFAPHVLVARSQTSARGARSAQEQRVRRVISGLASVVDGDGLEVEGVKIRLWGVDAPEVEQYCRRDDGTRWHCGQHATVALDALAGGRRVFCVQRERDAYQRALCVCKLGDRDLAAEQVRAGWALAYRKYSGRYIEEETAAAAQRLGMWAGRFEKPWDWREQMYAHERSCRSRAATRGARR